MPYPLRTEGQISFPTRCQDAMEFLKKKALKDKETINSKLSTASIALLRKPQIFLIYFPKELNELNSFVEQGGAQFVHKKN